jgi:squalene-hopene/tetraprenyl-beta-curcumene cyclase
MLQSSSILLASAVLFATSLVRADNPNLTPSKVDAAQYQKSVSRAVAFLKQAQADDGSYSAAAGPGVTGVATTALLRSGLTPQDPLVARSLKNLEGFIQEDGGVYQEGSTHRNYETCVAILCFTEANQDGRYDKTIKSAEKFVKGLQWDDEEGHDKSSTNYGGSGYGSHKRPDLSNTTFLIDALKAAGAGPDDEAMKRALVFVSRSQNLETEYNDTKFASKNPDGGFYYTPAAGGQSQAGELPGGGLRSYGSMTYAGLKSMIYAGVGPDDPRVKAAEKWVKKNYTLEQNPGMGDAGLYYYYHTFAKALDAIGDEEFADEEGKTHNWRAELVAELARRQQPNGSWLNENSRWLEGDPNLATAYSLLALSYCKPQVGATKKK